MPLAVVSGALGLTGAGMGPYSASTAAAHLPGKYSKCLYVGEKMFTTL